jgi:hypothetical protein
MVSVNRTASSNAGMKQRARPSKYATFEEDDRRNNLDGERKKLASFGGRLANQTFAPRFYSAVFTVRSYSTRTRRSP